MKLIPIIGTLLFLLSGNSFAEITAVDEGLELATCPLLGDFDLDGDVDGRDMLFFQREVGKVISTADGNGDFKVDSADLALWQANYGKAYPCPPAPTTMTASLDAFIKAKPVPSALTIATFTSYSATGCNLDLAAVHNASNWAYGVNLSPIAWHDNAMLGPSAARVCGPTLGRGVAITRRHLLSHHQHAPENPGTTVQFLRMNGEVVTRKLDSKYEIDGSGFFRILWMTEDLPEDMVATLPSADSVLSFKPIASLNKTHGLHTQYTGDTNNGYIGVNSFHDPDPIRRAYFKAPASGDSGKPLFAIMGKQMIPLAFWWTTGGGSAIHRAHGTILAAVDKLSAVKADTRKLQPKFMKVQ